MRSRRHTAKTKGAWNAWGERERPSTIVVFPLAKLSFNSTHIINGIVLSYKKRMVGITTRILSEWFYCCVIHKPNSQLFDIQRNLNYTTLCIVHIYSVAYPTNRGSTTLLFQWETYTVVNLSSSALVYTIRVLAVITAVSFPSFEKSEEIFEDILTYSIIHRFSFLDDFSYKLLKTYNLRPGKIPRPDVQKPVNLTQGSGKIPGKFRRSIFIIFLQKCCLDLNVQMLVSWVHVK